MYKSFFGLKKNPFNVNPDPAYLYLTPQISQSLDELTYGIENRKGLMILTGEAGTGKTTLINHLLSWLGHRRARTAFIFNSHLDSHQLFDFILADFEIPRTAQAQANPLLAFHDWLLARFRANDLVVLIIDEAQGLPVQVLEEIRLLLNMETPNEKLLQIVLAGQPELEIKLKRPDLQQVRQRIALRCKTAPLTLQETHAYIANRLHTAGAGSQSFFTREAVEAIHNYSRGVPRVINLLCENTLINAYVDQVKCIPVGIVDDVARELQFDEYKPAAPRVRTLHPAPIVPELNAILAKIQEDAEQAWAQTSAFKASPFLVGSRRQASEVSELPVQAGTDIDAKEIPSVPVYSRAGGHAGHRVTVWRRQRSTFRKFVSSNLAAAQALSLDIRRRSGMSPAFRNIQDLQLGTRTKQFVDDVRSAAQPHWKRLLESAGPTVRNRAAAAAESLNIHAMQLKNWLSRYSGEEMYGKTFVACAAMTAMLYLTAQKMTTSEPWRHPGGLIVAFAGLLLCALSLGLGVTILFHSRRKLLAGSSAMMQTAMRWLRAPIYPLHLRELGSMGKAHSQRRA